MLFAAPLAWVSAVCLGLLAADVDSGTVRRAARALLGRPPVVLVIGDSHANGSFGRHLRAELQSRGAGVVRVVGSCGRWSKAFVLGQRAHCGLRIVESDGSISWGEGCKANPRNSKSTRSAASDCRTPTIVELLQDMAPDLTVVALGGNAMFRGSKDDGWPTVAPWVDQLAAAVAEGGSACLWVTPPHGLNKSRRKMRHWAEFIADTTSGDCQVFDSGPHRLPYLDYRDAVDEGQVPDERHDGIHYDRLGKAGTWRVQKWAQDVASHAIGFAHPSTRTPDQHEGPNPDSWIDYAWIDYLWIDYLSAWLTSELGPG